MFGSLPKEKEEQKSNKDESTTIGVTSPKSLTSRADPAHRNSNFNPLEPEVKIS